MQVQELEGQVGQHHHNLVGADMTERGHKALLELARHNCCKLVQRLPEHHMREGRRRPVLSGHCMIDCNQIYHKAGQRWRAAPEMSQQSYYRQRNPARDPFQPGSCWASPMPRAMNF